MSIWTFAKRFSNLLDKEQLTLGEGATPLIRSRAIGPQAGLENLYFKLEAVNPTGSYKDRFAAAAVSEMLAEGKSRCVATSSGNTGSALAAYCAAVGMQCQIAIVETAPRGKLDQMLAYGADLIRVRGFGTDSELTAQTFQLLQQLGQQDDATLQISAYLYSPAGMRGVQTISYELDEQLGSSADHVFCPAGGGGLTLAVARGFDDLHREQAEDAGRPRVHCVQPTGNDTIASALRRRAANAEAVDCSTQISGLQVPSVVDGNEVISACRDSGGTGYVVEDAEVFALQSRLASEEGVFCEPAGAVALAGAIRAAADREIASDSQVVCLVTGSGFKDPPSVERMNRDKDCPLVEVRDIAGRFVSA